MVRTKFVLVQPWSQDVRTIQAFVAGCGLGLQLRAAVDRERIRRVRLDVRLALAAVEDVVGREEHDGRAELEHVLRPADVHRGRVLRGRLRSVDIRPGRRVEHDVDLGEAGGRRQRHVPLRPGQRHDARLGSELLAQRRPELPVGAGDEDAAAQLHSVSRTGARSRSGSHQARLAAYHSTVARSPSSNEISGSQPSSRRSFVESSR